MGLGFAHIAGENALTLQTGLTPLRELPATIAPGQDLAGVCDYLDASAGLRGWLVHARVPALPLRVEAWCNGRALGHSTAILDRPDLDLALDRRTWCGFLLGWSRVDRAALSASAPDALIELRVAQGSLRLVMATEALTAARALQLIDANPQGDLRPEFHDLTQWHRIEATGLFDARWYASHYGPDTEAQRPGLLHYIQTGEAEGRRPNLYLDPKALGLTLLDYPDGADLRPSVHFDPVWYRATHDLPPGTPALAHYLAHRPQNLPNGLVTLADNPASFDRYEDGLRAGLPDTPAPPDTPALAEILADARVLFAPPKPKPLDAQTLIQRLEQAVAAGDLPPAREAATLLRARDLTPWGRIALARLARAEGERATALDLLHPVTGEPALLITAAALLIELDDLAAAATKVAALGDLVSKPADQVRLRLAVRRRDPAALTALFTRGDLQAEPGVLCEAAYKLVRPGIPPEPGQEQAEQLLLQALARTSSDNPHTLTASIHILLQRRRLGELDSLLSYAELQPVAGKLNLPARRLEVLFLSDRLPEAVALYRRKLALAVLTRPDGIIVLRLLSEAKAWDEVARVILAHLAQGFGFGETVFHAMRAVRQAGLHAAILAADPPAQPDPDHGTFVDLVRMDHDLIRAASGQTATPGNLHWLAAPPAPATDHVVFLCADRRYFLSVLTFLASFFGQSRQTAAEVQVFLDKDVPQDWADSIAPLAARFGRRVQIISEVDFVPQGVALKTELGFFAAGTGLTRAAYYRIYAARHLMAQNRFARGLYLDSDIICRGDLTPLLQQTMAAPLAARVEDQGPEVIAAAKQNAIPPGRYFNSGVLVLDFAHPDLAPGLDRAIQLAETEPERLVFHDQCALNIAFRAGELAPQWNFFLRPFREDNGRIQDGILLHYLDRPKPWDITFWRNFREEWRVWALVVAQVLPDRLFTEMLAAANEV